MFDPKQWADNWASAGGGWATIDKSVQLIRPVCGCDNLRTLEGQLTTKERRTAVENHLFLMRLGPVEEANDNCPAQ